MTVAERVKYARGKRGLSQQGLAKAADVGATYVLMLERGDEDRPTNERIKQPGLEQVTKLAAALEVPAEWLAFGSGPDPFEGVPATERAS